MTPGDPLSPSLDAVEVVVLLAARKVLFTETGLNDMAFFTDEPLRRWPFSSGWVFEVSAFEASVSDPPLTLTSAEVRDVSIGSTSCLDSSLSVFGFPFTRYCSVGETSLLVLWVVF